MIDNRHDQDKQHRFFRDGAPYIDNFETVTSLLMGKQRQQDLFITTTLALIRDVQQHLVSCQKVLGKTERLIEEARSDNTSSERIDKLVDICRDLQSIQTSLVENVVDSMNNVIDNILPV